MFVCTIRVCYSKAYQIVNFKQIIVQINVNLCEQGKSEQQYEQSEEFKQQLKIKVREILTDQEWRRRKMAMRVFYPIFVHYIFAFDSMLLL